MAIKEKVKDLVRYRNEFNISSPILMDENGIVANAYGVWSHPATFLINREGKIIGRVLSGMDWTSGTMKNLLQHLLEEKR